MPLIPLQLPPGVYKNGTDQQAAGRWIDASLVRWSEGVMKPVAGWDEFTESSIGVPVRGSIGWRDNDGALRIVGGTYNGLHYIGQQGSIVDITPTGLSAGRIDAGANIGFGGGLFGVGSFGTPRTPTDILLPPTVWSMDTFGDLLLAVSPDDGRLVTWDNIPTNLATFVAGAPEDLRGVVVTEERFAMLLGADGDPRKVAWGDQESISVWNPAATNQAGEFVIQTSGSIMTGTRVRGQTLILTDVDAHTATYVGPPFVYGFERVGTNCGIIAPDAGASMEGGFIWMGRNGFYSFNGGAVERLPCDVADYIFGDINLTQKGKITAVCLAPQNEIWFFYPNGNENDRYVVYNYREQHWTVGDLGRTSGLECGVFERPLWFDSTGKLWRHEVGTAYPGAALPFAESGPFQLGAGDQVMSATSLIPDERTQGDVQVIFKTRFHPNDVERSYGPYLPANPTDVRFTGREVRMRVEGRAARPAIWRWGIPRVDAVAGGRR